MSYEFHNYLSGKLDKMLRENRVVVFYDPRSEFMPFIDEFESVGVGLGNLPRICINDTLTHIARFEGSFFTLKSAIEPVVCLDNPEPLLVYIPGQERDRQSSVLMEVEKAGACYEPQLRRLARNLLRINYTDGDIDEMLASEALTYHDVVRFMDQVGDDKTSLIKLVIGAGSSEYLLTEWLASAKYDDELASRLAGSELHKLIQSRLGLEIAGDASLEKTRRLTLRYILINEFRMDLTCDAPENLAMAPEPSSKDEIQRIREITKGLRNNHGAEYVIHADDIEREFALDTLGIDPASLGSIDTFRFEEKLLLHYTANLISKGHFDKALEVVTDRSRSFWVDQTLFLDRLTQWEACRLMAELGQAVTRIRPQIKTTGGDPYQWVMAYSNPNGWFEVDRAQRALASWMAKMEDDPEEPIEKAIGLIQRNHESLLKDMAKGFSKALVNAGWSIQNVLHQTHIFPEHVEKAGGKIAYFLVDAMRYEMGADLVNLLEGADDIRIQPAIGALPSITSIGMAALLPGASASFTVLEHKDKLAAGIEGHVMPTIAERRKYLKSVRPDAQDIDMGELLQKSTRYVSKKLQDANLIIVRSQSIDGLGEKDGGLLARQIMDTVIGNLARAVRKLSKMGIEYFVITADHGHQFSLRKEEDMMMDKPGGDTVDLHRRCWAGHGGHTPAASVRVSGAELSYNTDLDFVFPRGLAVFRTGGDLAFHHGGASLQEMVIPVITLRIPSESSESSRGALIVIDGYPKRLNNRTFGFRLIYTPDMFVEDSVSGRVVLIADGQEAGRAGMAPDAVFDRATATVQLPPRKKVSIGMMLTREDVKKIRIVVLDPVTDAILAQSDEIEVGELI